MADQQRLANVCAELNSRGVPFIQSNAYAPSIKDLYQGFRMIVVQAGRSINSNGQGRGKVREVLILGDSLILPKDLSQQAVRLAS